MKAAFITRSVLVLCAALGASATSASVADFCKIGTVQSPIDIRTGQTPALDQKLTFEYGKGLSVETVNSGYTIQANFPKGNSIKLNDKKFELKQVHFHAPAETQIDGKTFPMEAHFVHQSKTGSLAVVAVLFAEGKENKAYANLLGNLPSKKGDQVTMSKIEIRDLVPKSKALYSYVGSLTTPPCSEGVSWLVKKEIVELSAVQIHQFTSLYESNARAVQPLNGRTVWSQ